MLYQPDNAINVTTYSPTLDQFETDADSQFTIDYQMPLTGDVDGDDIVGIDDFLALLAAWGRCAAPCPPACAADLDDDCAVGIFDMLLLLANWD